MPRIAGVLGAFVLAVSAIGLNIMRYPAVWEIASPPASSAGTPQSSPVAATTKPSLAAEPAAPAPMETPSPGAAETNAPAAQPPPALTAAEAPDVASQPDAPAAQPSSAKPLVPVVRSDGEQSPPPATPTREIRRLPSVDPADPLSGGVAGAAVPPLTLSSIPIYPSTGY